ncbi:flagellar motor protein MotB [soil metagenome]
MSAGSSGGGAKAKPTIVVKRIKKVAGGHHGGAWKIAYADFVTAMMAFFLLMWLLGSTTQGDLKGIAEFFQNPMKVSMSGGSGAGDATSVITGGGRDLTSTSGQVKRGQPTGDTHKNADAEALKLALEKQEAKEKAGLEELKSKVNGALANDAKLAEFMSQIRLDITSEGLRIQIVDDQQRPMFDSGKAVMKPYMRDILREIAPVLNSVDNKITLLGHTDSIPFSTGEAGYSNWELSADRANASRRELIVGGLAETKTVRVAGLAASVPMLNDKPTDPQNRRISIIVMNKRAEDRFYNREPDTGAAAAAGPRVELSPIEKFAAQSSASVGPIAKTEH